MDKMHLEKIQAIFHFATCIDFLVIFFCFHPAMVRSKQTARRFIARPAAESGPSTQPRNLWRLRKQLEGHNNWSVWNDEYLALNKSLAAPEFNRWQRTLWDHLFLGRLAPVNPAQPAQVLPPTPPSPQVVNPESD